MESSGPADLPDADERHRRALAHAVLRGVVHDLNNPLATVTMAAAALRTAEDDAQRSELIDIVEREAMRAGALATEAAMSYAATPAPLTTMSLADLAARVGQLTAGSDVDLDAADGDDVRVSVDADLLPGALAALVADAGTAPGRRAAVRIAIGLDGADLTVTITDDGEALADAVAQRPFRPFVSGLRHGRGIGLAVAAARSHILGQGGQVGVRTGDSGTTVVVDLPGVAPDPVAQPADRGTSTERHPNRALVVDDSEPMRDLLSLTLRRAGWEVVTAADGAAAEAVLQAAPVAVVLLDLHLGAERGPEIAARLERVLPGTADRIVYLTGDPPASRLIDGRPVVDKPFTLEDLHRVIADVAAGDRPL